MTTREGLVHWHIIDEDGKTDLPDDGGITLVFDADLKDVIEAQALLIEGEMDFFDIQTGERLPCPLWWARKPFPPGETLKEENRKTCE